jgi:EAL domain-containing protein (putative c-di-GMP-specific phosphodiesterase class I)
VQESHVAIAQVAAGAFDVVLSDVCLPGTDGLVLLRRLRAFDADLPVVLMTGQPALESAIGAVDRGAYRYLVKPFAPATLTETIAEAVELRRVSLRRREALAMAGHERMGHACERDHAVVSGSLDSAWMAYQPIVDWKNRKTYAFEALLRSSDSSFTGPGPLIDAASRTGRVHEVGRAVRSAVATDMARAVDKVVFVNVHPQDLMDDALYAPEAPLSRVASRVVLEITERAGLNKVTDVAARVARLRQLGFRIAVDDLGAGYATLSSLAELRPEVVKLDMTLARGIDKDPARSRLISALNQAFCELGTIVVAEGVETEAERDALIAIGCSHLQGFLFALPARGFPSVRWPANDGVSRARQELFEPFPPSDGYPGPGGAHNLAARTRAAP